MSVMLPSSKLLPVTILATAFALSAKMFVLVTSLPTMAAVSAGTTQALQLAGTATVIAQANAAQAAPASPTLPRTAPTEESAPAPGPAQGADAHKAAADARKSAPPAADKTGDAAQQPTPAEGQEQKMTEREAALAAADKQLSARVTELLAIQARLEELEKQRKLRDEANWTGLVKVYESMKPRDAANIFNSLDKAVLLEILDRMKPAKASPIIALMESESARQITADLADKRTRDTTVAN